LCLQCCCLQLDAVEPRMSIAEAVPILPCQCCSS
jgi:hypothetical protein